MFQSDCLIDIPELAPVEPDPATAAKWFALVWFLALAVFEIWALRHGKNTLSHWLQRLSRAHKWLRWLEVIGSGLLVWHLFWGFPW